MTINRVIDAERLGEIERTVEEDIENMGFDVPRNLGYWVIPFNSSRRKEYAEILGGLNGSGILAMISVKEQKPMYVSKMFDLTDEGMEAVTRAYAGTPENIKSMPDIQEIRITVNPIAMDRNYASNLEKFKYTMTWLTNPETYHCKK